MRRLTRRIGDEITQPRQAGKAEPRNLLLGWAHPAAWHPAGGIQVIEQDAHPHPLSAAASSWLYNTPPVSRRARCNTAGPWIAPPPATCAIRARMRPGPLLG